MLKNSLIISQYYVSIKRGSYMSFWTWVAIAIALIGGVFSGALVEGEFE